MRRSNIKRHSVQIRRLLAVMLAGAMSFSMLRMSAAAADTAVQKVQLPIDIVDPASLQGDPILPREEVSLAAAQVSDLFWSTVPLSDGGTATVRASVVEGVHWFLMPASAGLAELPLNCSRGGELTVSGSSESITVSSGEVLKLSALCGVPDETGAYTLTVAVGGMQYTVKIRFSANVSAMYLTSSDPVNQGRGWVEASATKENKATGSMILQNPDGKLVYNGGLTQIKGRGNTTWNGAKKPYQIKLSDKTDLLETGSKSNKNKTWVLLANYYDGSLLHNMATYDLAAAMGMDCTVEYRPIDLYYDGEYRGSYLLTEKVAVDSGRVEIADLEDATEKANSAIEDLSQVSRSTGTTENGATYRYCEGLASPADITGGYLLEMDYQSRAVQEACYFRTKNKNYIVVKSPEFCSQAEMEYIAGLYQEFEDAVYGGGTNTATGKSAWDYMDLTSVAQCFMINELSKNPDAFLSSAYIYKDAGDGKMHMGPVWDYDLAWGYGNISNYINTTKIDGWFSAGYGIGAALVALPEFCAEADRVFAARVYPLVKNVLLGDENAVSRDGSLRSLKWYEGNMAASAAANYTIWNPKYYYLPISGVNTYDEHLAYFRSWMTQRLAWMNANTLANTIHFGDVNTAGWYWPAVRSVAAAGIMRGDTIGTFRPNSTMSRAEMAQVLYNLAGRPAYTPTAALRDVSSGVWYYPAICWCYENGMINGYPDGTFRPGEEIIRQDVVVLLYRAEGSPAIDGDRLSGFADGGTVNAYARPACEWALEHHLLQGYPDGTLLPKNSITRAECASLLSRLYLS